MAHQAILDLAGAPVKLRRRKVRRVQVYDGGSAPISLASSRSLHFRPNPLKNPFPLPSFHEGGVELASTYRVLAAALCLVQPPAGQFKNVHIAFVPRDRQLACPNLPALRSSDETVRVIAVHDLVAPARLVGKVMTSLYISDASGLIAVERDYMIRDHVLGGLHSIDGAAGELNPVGGFHALRRHADG